MDQGILSRSSRSGVILIVTALAVTWLDFAYYTATNWLAFPKFLLATSLLFTVPGYMLLHLGRLGPRHIEGFTLATCLGMVAAGLIYVALGLAGAAGLLWLWFLAALVWAGLTRDRWLRQRPAIEGRHLPLLLVLIASWLPVLTVGYLGRNLSWTRDGGMGFSHIPDVFLHTSVTAELTHTVQPQVPYLSGQPLNYHVGMDMVAAILARFGGLSPADLVVRDCPILFVSLAVLGAFCLARRLTGSDIKAAFCALLAILGDDFSFIPGLLQFKHEYWILHYFQVSSEFTVYLINPMTLGIAFLFVGLVCLHGAITEGRRAWFLAGALCLAALIEIKIFLFIQISIVLIIIAAIDLAIYRRTAYLRFGLLLILMSLPFAATIYLANKTGGEIIWALDPGLSHYVTQAMTRLDLPALLAYPPLAVAVFLVGALGVCMLGLPALVRALKFSRDGLFLSFLALFILVGIVLTLTTSILPHDNPAGFDNVFWFFAAAKNVAPIFLIMTLSGLLDRDGWRRRVLVVGLMGGSLSGSAESLLLLETHVSLSPIHMMNADQMAAITALNNLASPAQVVLAASDGWDNALLAMTRLHLPYSAKQFVDTLASRQNLAARAEDVALFRQAWANGTVREDILARYRVEWVLAPHARPAPATRTLRLDAMLDNKTVTLYRVHGRTD